jgi:hypothetical protein
MPRGRPVKCIHCGGTDTTGKGARKTKTMGIRKIRRCRSCGRRFTPKNQKPVQYGSTEAPQAETTESSEPGRAGESSASIVTEELRHGHQMSGL